MLSGRNVMTPKAWKIVRGARTAVQLLSLAVVSVAVAAGYSCLLTRMQIVPAMLACSVVWLLAWIVITVLVGRVYCSTVCPLGTFQDIMARLGIRRRGYFYTVAMTPLRWLMVIAAVAAAVMGLWEVVALLDPYSEWADIINRLGIPAYERVAEALGRRPVLRAVTVSLASGAFTAVIAGVIVYVAATRGRRICNTVCPVGTLLGAVARLSVYHVDIDTDRCTGCNRCVERCKGTCINPWEHTVDLSRCVVCLDCLDVCPNQAITFRRGRHRLQMPLMMPAAGYRFSRRMPSPRALLTVRLVVGR